MIAPTREYDGMPALSPTEAGRWMIDAARHRPVRIAPRFGVTARAIDGIAPGVLNGILKRQRDATELGRTWRYSPAGFCCAPRITNTHWSSIATSWVWQSPANIQAAQSFRRAVADRAGRAAACRRRRPVSGCAVAAGPRRLRNPGGTTRARSGDRARKPVRNRGPCMRCTSATRMGRL